MILLKFCFFLLERPKHFLQRSFFVDLKKENKQSRDTGEGALFFLAVNKRLMHHQFSFLAVSGVGMKVMSFTRLNFQLMRFCSTKNLPNKRLRFSVRFNLD